MELLTAKDRAEIEDAIAQVEKRTAAEIVVTRVPESDRYVDIRLLFAGWLSLASVTLAHLIWPGLQVGELLLLELMLAFAGYWAAGYPALLRRLVPKHRREAAVERAARLSFLKHGIFRTRERTGVLILLSELEHKVTVLGDEGVHQLLQEAGWSKLVATIVQGIREGHAARGICSVISELGELLAQGVPVRPDDTNELSNRVRDDDAPA